jgi:hypothetical protein
MKLERLPRGGSDRIGRTLTFRCRFTYVSLSGLTCLPCFADGLASSSERTQDEIPKIYRAPLRGAVKGKCG